MDLNSTSSVNDVGGELPAHLASVELPSCDLVGSGVNASDVYTTFSDIIRHTANTATWDLGENEDTEEALEWIEKYNPSCRLSCQNLDYLLMYASEISEETKAMCTEKKERGERVTAQWNAWQKVEGTILNWSKIENLAQENGYRGGKWLMHIDDSSLANNVWRKLALALIGNHLPKSCAYIRVNTPKLDELRNEIVGVSRAKVIHVWNDNWQDHAAILAIEKALRQLGAPPPAEPMSYKPDVLAAIGIHRNSVWKLQPTTFVSKIIRGSQPPCTVVYCKQDPKWSYDVVTKSESAGE